MLDTEPRQELHFVSAIKAINQGKGKSRRISMDTEGGRELGEKMEINNSCSF